MLRAGNSSALIIYIPSDISNDSACSIKVGNRISIKLLNDGSIIIDKKYKRKTKDKKVIKDNE